MMMIIIIMILMILVLSFLLVMFLKTHLSAKLRVPKFWAWGWMASTCDGGHDLYLSIYLSI